MDRIKDESKKVLFVMDKIKDLEKIYIPIFKWLKLQGYEIHIISSQNEEVQYCDKCFKLSFFKYKLKAYKFLKEIIKQNHYSFIHCHTFLGGIFTRLIARKNKTKVIYLAQEFPFYKGSHINKWLKYYLLEKFLAKYTDILITTNEEDFILAKNKFKVPKIELINGIGVDENVFDSTLSEKDSKKIQEEFNIKKEDYVFLNIGTLDKNNYQILQIEAVMQIINEYKNIKLLILGDGPLEEYYSNIIEKYNLSNYISLVRDTSDIKKLILLSDVFITTNKLNRKTNYIIEAMFANKPIVASDIKIHRKLLKEENLVELSTADELITKLEKNIIAGRRKIYYDIEKFKLKNIVKTIENIYGSFIHFC